MLLRLPIWSYLTEFLKKKKKALLKCIALSHLTCQSDLQNKYEVVLKGAQLYVHCSAVAMANTTANRC